MILSKNKDKLKTLLDDLYIKAAKHYLYSSALKCVRNFHELNKDPEETTYYAFICATFDYQMKVSQIISRFNTINQYLYKKNLKIFDLVEDKDFSKLKTHVLNKHKIFHRFDPQMQQFHNLIKILYHIDLKKTAESNYNPSNKEPVTKVINSILETIHKTSHQKRHRTKTRTNPKPQRKIHQKENKPLPKMDRKRPAPRPRHMEIHQQSTPIHPTRRRRSKSIHKTNRNKNKEKLERSPTNHKILQKNKPKRPHQIRLHTIQTNNTRHMQKETRRIRLRRLFPKQILQNRKTNNEISENTNSP